MFKKEFSRKISGTFITYILTDNGQITGKMKYLGTSLI